MSKHMFVGRWGEILPHHPTQMAKVMGAEMISYDHLRFAYGEETNIKADLYDSDSVLWCSRMVSSFDDLMDISRFGSSLVSRKKKPKIIMYELEGLTHHSLAHFGKSLNKKALPYFAQAMAYSDLVIASSEENAEDLRTLVPGTNVQLFGFIPEEDEIYDYCIEHPAPIEDRDETILICAAAKKGFPRGALHDVLAASKIKEYFDTPIEIAIIPLSNEDIHPYDILCKGLHLKLMTVPLLPYQEFLRVLASLDLIINLDPLDGYSRLASECARVKTPCIGMRHSTYQKKYFNDISVDVKNLDQVASIAADLIKQGDKHPAVEKAYRLAKKDNREAHIKEWKTLLTDIGVKL